MFGFEEDRNVYCAEAMKRMPSLKEKGLQRHATLVMVYHLSVTPPKKHARGGYLQTTLGAVLVDGGSHEVNMGLFMVKI